MFLLNPKICIKGTVAWDFLPPISPHESTGFHDRKLKNWSSQVADFRKNCDCGIAELRLRSIISLKVVELRLRKCFLQVAELRLRTQKKVSRAHLWWFVMWKRGPIWLLNFKQAWTYSLTCPDTWFYIAKKHCMFPPDLVLWTPSWTPKGLTQASLI